MSNDSVIRLKPEYVSSITANPALLGAIAQATNKGINTIRTWCKNNDSRLTMLSVLVEVRKFHGLEKHAVVTEHIKIEIAA